MSAVLLPFLAASVHVSLGGIIIGILLAILAFWLLSMIAPAPIPAVVAILIFVVCAFDFVGCC